jgi:hypothetical protein
MTQAGTELFRVRIEVYDPFGNLDETHYLGPYDAKPVAKGRRTTMVREFENYYVKKGGTVKGFVERVVDPTWEQLDD